MHVPSAIHDQQYFSRLIGIYEDKAKQLSRLTFLLSDSHQRTKLLSIKTKGLATS